MDDEKSNPPNKKVSDDKGDELAPNAPVEDFFTRMNYDMRRPKPGQEAVSAALQAIQRLGVRTDSEDSVAAEEMETESVICAACGGRNPQSHKFCATCGVPLLKESGMGRTRAAPHAGSVDLTPGPHHYHHHYHHHYFASETIAQPGTQLQARDNTPPHDAIRGRTLVQGAGSSRAEAAVKKIAQDWALACNTSHLDDLVELYSADAQLLRPNVPPVRGAASIREFLFSVLQAGLGEVEMDPMRVDVFGDVACETGRCKMLVPSTMGKRREERGKYLLVLTKLAGEWKIFADCWSSDLTLG